MENYEAITYIELIAKIKNNELGKREIRDQNIDFRKLVEETYTQFDQRSISKSTQDCIIDYYFIYSVISLYFISCTFLRINNSFEKLWKEIQSNSIDYSYNGTSELYEIRTSTDSNLPKLLLNSSKHPGVKDLQDRYPILNELDFTSIFKIDEQYKNLPEVSTLYIGLAYSLGNYTPLISCFKSMCNNIETIATQLVFDIQYDNELPIIKTFKKVIQNSQKEFRHFELFRPSEFFKNSKWEEYFIQQHNYRFSSSGASKQDLLVLTLNLLEYFIVPTLQVAGYGSRRYFGVIIPHVINVLLLKWKLNIFLPRSLFLLEFENKIEPFDLADLKTKSTLNITSIVFSELIHQNYHELYPYLFDCTSAILNGDINSLDESKFSAIKRDSPIKDWNPYSNVKFQDISTHSIIWK